MNPIVFALRRPFTVMVAMIAIAVGSVLAWSRIPIDIFPELHLPAIYVCQPYGGMDPAQMEGLITNYYEYHFLYISGIHHVESKNVQGMSLMKLAFHPGTDMAQAMAETINYVNRSRAFMPTGTVPPFVMRFDTGSVPVGYLVLSTKNPNRTVGEMQRMALFDVRPIFASLPGVSAPPPFGASQRSIVLKLDPQKLDAQGATVQDVVNALSAGNTISPSGNLYVQDQMPIVRLNAVAADPKDLGNIPLRAGSPICLRDIGQILDTTDIPTGIALVNGRPTVYMLVNKRADASTLSVVNEVKGNLGRMRKALPDDIDIEFEFDQSPYVTRAMMGVGIEGGLGAILTGLMVLVFLRDWRSVLVVVLNIPLAILGALVALWLTGNSLNLMTLGGLALAIGILVDEATVEVENIHTQFTKTDNIARAVRQGNLETAVPRLLAMLCVVAVFLPSFFMEGAARGLFVPLSLAVGFAMITSYLLSSTLVPVLSVWLLRHAHAADESKGRFARLRERYAKFVERAIARRRLVVLGYVGGVVLFAGWWLLGHWGVGTEIFPAVDAGQIQFRLYAPTGTRITWTEPLVQETFKAVEEMVGPDNVRITLAYVGIVPPSYPINAVYRWSSGPEEAMVRIAFKRGSGVRVADIQERMRNELPKRLQAFFAAKLELAGLPSDVAHERAAKIHLTFEPADIVNEVMSFGSPAPVEIAVSGPNLAENRAVAEKLYERLKKIPTLRDLQFAQPLDYPAVDVKIDREKLGLSGGNVKAITESVIAATSSSRFMVPMYWPDPKTGIGFQVQVEIPADRLPQVQDLGLLVVNGSGDGPPVRLRDVADINRSVAAGEYDRYNMRRLVSLTANIAGEDLGGAALEINRAIQSVGELPRGVMVDVRGQIPVMRDMFRGLAIGLALATVAIFLLLTAYFQSPRLTVIIMAVVPSVLFGVAAALTVTRTTLNLQSFMGAIMAIGVGVANAILLISFAERGRLSGESAEIAVSHAAQQRLRPILMTSFAMIAGMLPMAFALGEGGEQTAPLGRAVIGGLIAATLTTLGLLPLLFVMIQSRASTASPSLDPDDSASRFFDRKS